MDDRKIIGVDLANTPDQSVERTVLYLGNGNVAVIPPQEGEVKRGFRAKKFLDWSDLCGQTKEEIDDVVKPFVKEMEEK